MRRTELCALAATLLLALPAAGEGEQRIVSAPSVSLREAPGAASRVAARLALGVLVVERGRTSGVETVGGATAPWLRVATASGEEGWLFGALTLPYADARRDAIALEIAAERLGRKGDPFEPLAELFAYLSRAAAAASAPDAAARLGLARLRALDRSCEAIGVRRLRDPKVAAWVEANGRDLVFNEPAARWLVVADRYWELHDRHATLPFAEEIAWAGARALLPGECEGDLPCSVAWLSRTDVRYLERHPRGAHAGEALSKVAVLLDGALEDPRGAGALAGSPAEDVARLRKDLAKLKEVLAPIDDPRARAARSAADTLLSRAGPGTGGRR